MQGRKKYITFEATNHQFDKIVNQYTDIFKGMIEHGAVEEMDPKVLSLEFTGPTAMLIQLSDREPSRRQEAIDMIEKHVDVYINFIGQINKAMENVDVSFIFDYNNNRNIEGSDEGLLIIGADSYEKNRDDLISIYSTTNSFGSDLNWVFDIDKITIGDNFFEFNNEEFIIKTDIDGIEIPYSFYELLKRIYFNTSSKKNLPI